MNKELSQAEKELVRAMKVAHIDKGTFVVLGVLCGKKDEHATAMAKYISEHPNVDDTDIYIDKAYEIIGEPRPEYYVDGKKV